MKREFLQNFKVGDQALTKEIIDAILDENSRDIGAVKATYADYDTIKTQLEEARTTIKGLESQDIEAVRKSAKDWEEKYNHAVEEHEAKLADMEFDRKIEDAISSAKGKNAKAIRALLDVDTLKASKNQDADIKTAMDALQKESGYLFGDKGNPPPYSAGTGTGSVGGTIDGVTAAFSKLNPGLKI